MNVKVYYSKQWIDITNDILFGQITLADRCDEAFGVGNFTFESNVITDLIPAYSRLLVDDKYYLCSSEITQNLVTKTYIHNVEVLDATAIFSRFIVGSKNFSVTGTYQYDYQKVGILTNLMDKKYNINIVAPENLRALNKKIEYTFGAGTTLYDAICEILKPYNKRIKVTSITDTAINYELIDLDGAFYTLNENDILSYSIRQNIDDYCKKLEGEFTNVIDRNNYTVLSNYTCRIDDVKLDYDNCKILLPTAIEQLNKFSVYSKGMFSVLNIKGEYFKALGTYYPTINTWDYDIPDEAQTISYWLNIMASSSDELDYGVNDTPLFKILEQIASAYGLSGAYELFNLKLKADGNSYTNSNGEYDFMFDLIWDDANEGMFEILADMTNWVVEKNKYDILEAREKPLYAYYKKGDNYIDGMNVVYKDDFWNKVLGIAVQPFFSHHNIGGDEVFSDTASGMYALVGKTPLNTNPVLNKYYMEYNAIANPIVIVDKNEEMLNCSRSYSKGSNFIDFDKLVEAMNIDNSYLGKPELSMELNVSNYTTLPQVANKITFKERTWYLSNYTITYSLDNTIMNLNFVSNYNKLADVIGVATQYEETKNPLENIIDRPIVIEQSYQVVDRSNLWLKFNFDNGRSLFKRATLLEYSNYRILYCEMLDHYAFDKETIKDSKANVYTCNDVPYGNSYNEATKVKIEIIEMPNLTFEQSMALPYYTGTYTTILSIPEMYIYKDARERLLFTILLK